MPTLFDGVEGFEHQELLKVLIKKFQDSGLKIVKASLAGYDEPYKIGRHEPDIIAMDGRGLLVIGEAKCCDDLNSRLTEEQFQDFSNSSMLNGGGKVADFHIMIPESCELQLGKVLSELALTSRTNIYCWTREQQPIDDDLTLKDGLQELNDLESVHRTAKNT